MRFELTKGGGCGPDGEDPWRTRGVKVSALGTSLAVAVYTTDVLRNTLKCLRVFSTPVVRDCGSYRHPMSEERVRCEDCEAPETFGWRVGPVTVSVTRPCSCPRCREIREASPSKDEIVVSIHPSEGFKRWVEDKERRFGQMKEGDA